MHQMGRPANSMDNHVRHYSLCAVITMDTISWNEKNREIVGSGNGNKFLLSISNINSEKFVKTHELS